MMKREEDKQIPWYTHVNRFALVGVEPYVTYDIIVEIRRGNSFQIYRQPFSLAYNETDVRFALGDAMEQIGQKLKRTDGFPLVDERAPSRLSEGEREFSRRYIEKWANVSSNYEGMKSVKVEGE